ncbi:hypothetical protein B0H13DRAFT_1888665 [Mycena leptocephala]|nr:hypothetical protein B0H13DRAFT_1888665 [Mycena leptocephala]
MARTPWAVKLHIRTTSRSSRRSRDKADRQTESAQGVMRKNTNLDCFRYMEQPEAQAESVVKPEHAAQGRHERVAEELRTRMNSHVAVTRSKEPGTQAVGRLAPAGRSRQLVGYGRVNGYFMEREEMCEIETGSTRVGTWTLKVGVGGHWGRWRERRENQLRGQGIRRSAVLTVDPISSASMDEEAEKRMNWTNSEWMRGACMNQRERKKDRREHEHLRDVHTNERKCEAEWLQLVGLLTRGDPLDDTTSVVVDKRVSSLGRARAFGLEPVILAKEACHPHQGSCNLESAWTSRVKERNLKFHLSISTRRQTYRHCGSYTYERANERKKSSLKRSGIHARISKRNTSKSARVDEYEEPDSSIGSGSVWRWGSAREVYSEEREAQVQDQRTADAGANLRVDCSVHAGGRQSHGLSEGQRRGHARSTRVRLRGRGNKSADITEGRRLADRQWKIRGDARAGRWCKSESEACSGAGVRNADAEALCRLRRAGGKQQAVQLRLRIKK